MKSRIVYYLLSVIIASALAACSVGDDSDMADFQSMNASALQGNQMQEGVWTCNGKPCGTDTIALEENVNVPFGNSYGHPGYTLSMRHFPVLAIAQHVLEGKEVSVLDPAVNIFDDYPTLYLNDLGYTATNSFYNLGYSSQDVRPVERTDEYYLWAFLTEAEGTVYEFAPFCSHEGASVMMNRSTALVVMQITVRGTAVSADGETTVKRFNPELTLRFTATRRL